MPPTPSTRPVRITMSLALALALTQTTTLLVHHSIRGTHHIILLLFLFLLFLLLLCSFLLRQVIHSTPVVMTTGDTSTPAPPMLMGSTLPSLDSMSVRTVMSRWPLDSAAYQRQGMTYLISRGRRGMASTALSTSKA